jgi:hypothetical protein
MMMGVDRLVGWYAEYLRSTEDMMEQVAGAT